MLCLTVVGCRRGPTVTFEFIDESGRPLSNAKFYLYKMQGDTFVKAIHRHSKLDGTARITVPDAPMDFMVGVQTQDEFYEKWWTPSDLALSNGTVRLQVQKTGIIAFRFSSFPPAYGDPLVVSCSKMQTNGQYEHVSGIGIFFSSEEAPIGGLGEGLYRLQLKHNYEDDHVIWEESDIKVRAGQRTTISNIVVTAKDL